MDKAHGVRVVETRVVENKTDVVGEPLGILKSRKMERFVVGSGGAYEGGSVEKYCCIRTVRVVVGKARYDRVRLSGDVIIFFI